MQRRLIAGLVGLSLVLACAFHERQPLSAGVRHLPTRTLNLHADTGFRTTERAAIAAAVGLIREQTAGLLNVNITYDLDFENIESIIRLGNDDLLVRAPPAAPYVTFEDSSGGRLLGVVGGVNLANYDAAVVKRIYLVADRLWSHDVFVHVTEHELYHAFGLRHVDDPQGIMFFQVKNDIKPSLCIGKDDAIELCRVIDCQIKDINYCD